MEIQISNIAKGKILEAAKENKTQPSVRLYVISYACSGAKFGIAFDEPKQNDVLTEINGIEFITDTEYMPKFSDGINIDYMEKPKEGYIITSIRPIKKSCGTDCNGCKH